MHPQPPSTAPLARPICGAPPLLLHNPHRPNWRGQPAPQRPAGARAGWPGAPGASRGPPAPTYSAIRSNEGTEEAASRWVLANAGIPRSRAQHRRPLYRICRRQRGLDRLFSPPRASGTTIELTGGRLPPPQRSATPTDQTIGGPATTPPLRSCASLLHLDERYGAAVDALLDLQDRLQSPSSGLVLLKASAALPREHDQLVQLARRVLDANHADYVLLEEARP